MTFDDIINKKKKEWNCSDLMNTANITHGEKLPFSSPLMNWCTYGGIPRDKITEFFGEFSGGKTTTAVDICKNAIEIFKQEYMEHIELLSSRITSGDKSARSELEDFECVGPKKVTYIDLEHTFDLDWSEKLGIAHTDIKLMQPPDVPAEDILQTIEDLICTGEIGLLVLDSIPSLVTGKELEKKYGERTVAPLAGLLTIFFRKIVPKLSRYHCTLLTINQTRDNLDNPYVANTPGGKAAKFYAGLRVQFRIGAPVDFIGNELPTKTENPAGYIINAKIVKQKTAPYDRKQGSYFLMCQSGIRPDFDYASLAIKRYGVIHKAGAWFTICDPYTGEVLETADGKPIKLNGLSKVYEYLATNTEYYERLKKFITDDINGITTDAGTEDENGSESNQTLQL